jgi:hypothetical protein
MVGCHTPPAVCIQPTLHTQPVALCPQTQPVNCGIVPPTIGGCTLGGCGQGLPQQQGAPQMLPQPMAAGAPQAFSQNICPTPSAVQQCGQPLPFSQQICPTPSAVQQCGQPLPFSQQICPTPSAVQQCGQPQQTLGIVCTQVFVCGGHTIQHTQCICPTPTVTANIACLQTANTPCLPFTLGGCAPQSIACVQNGVFTPFGR